MKFRQIFAVQSSFGCFAPSAICFALSLAFQKRLKRVSPARRSSFLADSGMSVHGKASHPEVNRVPLLANAHHDLA